MRKRQAFLMNSTVILLLIPLMLLLATYEDVSSQIIMSQSERTQIERTYRIVSYIELDFQRTLEISGKRSIVTIVDYIASTGNFLDPDNTPANVTMRDLILFEEANGIDRRYSDKLMKDQTIFRWLLNISSKLRGQGYIFEIENTSIPDIANMPESDRKDILRRNIEIIVAPLDSFRVVVKARINNVRISDMSSNVIYEGSIPRNGYVYSMISIENLEDPMFSALSGGRYFRSIKACSYAYPELIEKPIDILYGNGTSDRDHVVGLYSSTPDLDHIFYGTSYPSVDAKAYVLKDGNPDVTSYPIIVNTSLIQEGERTDPRNVFEDGDLGVLVFGVEGYSAHWCDTNYKWRVNITIPSYPDGSLVLLKIPTSLFPGIYSSENTSSMKIYEKSDTSCVPVEFWIEYWGTSYAWIWIKTSGTQYTIYFTDNPAYARDGYNKESLFWLIDTFDGTAGSSPNPNLWNNPGGTYLDGNGNLVVPAGIKKLALQTVDTLTSSFFVRFKMAPELIVEDFDAGIQVSPEISSNRGYLKVFVSYPSSVQDVQIPIYLNATTAQKILHDALNRAQIEIYSDESLTTPVPFWIEYWSDNGALLWIRGDLPGTFYIRYNTGTYRRGNGDAVFPFFDDFNETLSKWIIDPYNQGARASIDTTGNGTVTIDGGDSLFVMMNKNPLDIPYDFAVRFRMKPNFREIGDWDAGIGLWDEKWEYYGSSGPWWRRTYYYLLQQLFTDDIYWNGDTLTVHWAEWKTRNPNPTSISDFELSYFWAEYDADSDITTNRDYAFHTYEVAEFLEDDETYFTDLTRSETNRYDSPYTTLESLEYIYLVIDSEYWNRGATYDWIFVRKLINDDELSYEITDHPVTYDLQFIDDTSATNEDHGGDFLGILEDWGESMVSTSTAPVYSSYVYRYEGNFTPSNGNVELSFARISSTGSVNRVETSLNDYPQASVKVGLVIDNRNNDAYFDWILIGLGSYYSIRPSEIISSGVETVPETRVAYTAKAYDLQPFVECIINMKYFGTYDGWSFFERLENSGKNHNAYFELAKQMQDELGIKYGNEYYPIGLVSFMIPHRIYDEKLFNIFTALQITLDEGISSVDYNFLNYYFNNKNSPISEPAYRVWGISYADTEDINTVLGNPLDIPFFMDTITAHAIFGSLGAQDLLKG